MKMTVKMMNAMLRKVKSQRYLRREEKLKCPFDPQHQPILI